MVVSRWDPLHELLSLQQRMNRLFDNSLSRSRGEEEQQEMAAGTWAPPVDIHEGPDKIHLRADIPGVRQEDIEVRIENSVLVIRGERRMEPQSKREDFLRVERPYGTFSRSFSLPPTLDLGRVGAEYHNGVLEVTLHKRPETQAHTVKIDVQ